MPRHSTPEEKREKVKAKNARYYEKHKAELKEKRLEKLNRPLCCVYICNLPNNKVYVDLSYTDGAPISGAVAFNIQVIPVLEFYKELDEATLRSFLFMVMKYYGKDIVINYNDYSIENMDFLNEVSYLKEEQHAFFNRCLASALTGSY